LEEAKNSRESTGEHRTDVLETDLAVMEVPEKRELAKVGEDLLLRSS